MIWILEVISVFRKNRTCNGAIHLNPTLVPVMILHSFWALITFLVLGSCFLPSVKKGGPNPVSNTVLASVLERAKELDVPKEIVERNIKRASEKGQEAYIEKLYEVGKLVTAYPLFLSGQPEVFPFLVL